MINELIEQAKQIEATTDANMGGALIQVSNKLTIDECATIFKERCGDNAKKAALRARLITRVRDEVDPKWFNVGHLRNDVLFILQAALRGR